MPGSSYVFAFVILYHSQCICLPWFLTYSFSSQTRISAKAQRKIAREIKTARAFGLMPFTTMGRRPFIFGRSAEEHYSEEEYFGFVKQKDDEPVEDNGDAEPNVEAV